MIRVILCGCNGKMGKAMSETVEKHEGIEIVAGVDVFTESEHPYPVYSQFSEINTDADIIVDFSDPSALKDLLDYSVEKNLPCIECTTGYSPEHVEMLKKASESIPVFYSGNMSLGINLITELSKIAARVLGEKFDIEILERHHNTKVDAPSGTALMLANSISQELDYPVEYIYDRHSVRKKRDSREIGIHSIRGGNLVGEHEVIFAGEDEAISIKHTAQSKTVLAVGAINAARYLVGKQKGFYSMNDLLMNK